MKWTIADFIAAMLIGGLTGFLLWQSGQGPPRGMLTIDMRDSAPQQPPHGLQ